MARADTFYFVAHSRISKTDDYPADTISQDGAQDLVQAGMAKMYWSAVNNAYYVRFKKKNNSAMVAAILAAYVVNPD